MPSWRLIFTHRWRDSRDSRRALPDQAAQALQARIAASEAAHTGEIRIVVESALPLSYLWRVDPELPVAEAVRQRALAWFGRLRIWDTEHNNGVLIYLQLAERQVDLVADRGLARHVPASAWQSLVAQLTESVKAQGFEPALQQAVDAIDALLRAHCPLDGANAGTRVNQLSNRVVRC